MRLTPAPPGQVNQALDALAICLACHALCLIDQAGILTKLRKHGVFTNLQILKLKNPHLVRAAFATLIGAKFLDFDEDKYFLTHLGLEVSKNIGSITMPLIGYRKLFEKQFELLEHPHKWRDSDIDYRAIANSSVNFGRMNYDQIISDLFLDISPKGTICDLGCGTGEKLANICSQLGTYGLGIEKNIKVIKASKIFKTHSPKIEIICSDVTDLDGVWEDVEVAMINLLFHDIAPPEKALRFLKSLFKHFPRLRRLVITDIVSFSATTPSILPGFDYVHGLQGMTPRNYEETIQLFANAELQILNEIKVPDMPNTFIWVVAPTKKYTQPKK